MDPLIIGIFAIFFVWMSLLTILLVQIKSHYDRLTKDTVKADLTTILEAIVKQIQGSKKDIAMLKDLCARIESEGQSHVQKIGLLRFNPFKDTGGEQSFIVSLLDAKDSGIVISGLYSRSGTRWYAKKVKNGKGIDHELSADEKKAIEEADHITKNEKQ